jgi:hypothetical protein
LTLRDELAGKTIRCPQCAKNLQVPEPVEEIDEVEEARAAAPTPQAAMRPGAPPQLPGAGAGPGAGGDDDDLVEVDVAEEDVAAGPPPLPKDDGYAAAPPPVAQRIKDPKPKKKKKSVYSEMYGKDSGPGRVIFEEGWFGSGNGGIIGGALMILAAVALFLVLFFIGRIFAYGMIFIIILFVAGMLSILKGLMDLY